MTSPSPSPIAPGLTGQLDAAEPPFSPAPVEELLRLVSKAARAQQLYLPNNPIYRAAFDALRAGFAPLWQEADELVLTVLESEMHWYDAVVLPQNAGGGPKSPDNLAWLFYKDGVRELKLLKGFEQQEIVPFLTIIQRARKASPDEDDLVSMLWEADFSLLQYKYVDLLQEGGGGEDLADGGQGGGPAAPTEVQRGAQEAVEESRESGVVNMSDFDATLYFLDDREIDYLHSEIEREYNQDLRSNVASVLLDIFELQADGAVRTEVVECVHALMVYLLTSAHFRGVAHLLREGRAALQRATDVAPAHRDMLAELADRLSSPDALSQLLQALDDAPALPPEGELAELFDELRPSALGTVFLWLSKTDNDRLRPLLESAAGRLAAANTAELVRLIQAPEPEVSAEAIRRAGALKAQAAVQALAKVLTDPNATRRQLAAHALSEIGSPGAMQALERVVEDADRDVRLTTARAFRARTHRPALARLEAVVKGRGVRDADLTEKMAFFEAYGAVCGDAGVAQLDAILNGKGLLGRREDPETRACAAIALGRVGTTRAQETLRKAATEKDVVVRNAVSRALRGGGGAA
ncbi:MAG: HEAT repeat domain-containing protein [Gemmatimonadales bacterium]